jgi:hypothetical protein
MGNFTGTVPMKLLPYFLSLILTACFPMFSEDACDESVQQQIKSEALSVLLTVSKKDCGATTLPVTHVYIRKIGDTKPEKFGDRIYTARRDTKTSVSVSDNSIVVQSDATTNDVFLKLDRWRGIDVVYK